MKNKAGFYTTSVACAARGEEAATTCILARDIDAAGFSAWDAGCEWHHASGNRIAFFAETDEELAALKAFKEKIAAFKAAAVDLPKSKAAVWRGLVPEDQGFGGVDFKNGKYGRFVCSFGKPDGRLYFPSEEFATSARRLLKI